jgi:hypothetical protein
MTGSQPIFAVTTGSWKIRGTRAGGHGHKVWVPRTPAKLSTWSFSKVKPAVKDGLWHCTVPSFGRDR